MAEAPPRPVRAQALLRGFVACGSVAVVEKSARTKRTQLQNANPLCHKDLWDRKVDNEPKSKPVAHLDSTWGHSTFSAGWRVASRTPSLARKDPSSRRMGSGPVEGRRGKLPMRFASLGNPRSFVMSDTPQEPSRTRPRLILASASPRRAELMREYGYEVEVVVPPLAEPTQLTDDVSAAQQAEALSYFKARSVAAVCKTGWVIAGDTVVAVDDRVFGKPVDRADAGIPADGPSSPPRREKARKEGGVPRGEPGPRRIRRWVPPSGVRRERCYPRRANCLTCSETLQCREIRRTVPDGLCFRAASRGGGGWYTISDACGKRSRSPDADS